MLSNRIYIYWCIFEFGDGVVDGILEFVGWVVVKWILLVYFGIFVELKERGRRKEMKILICERVFEYENIKDVVV